MRRGESQSASHTFAGTSRVPFEDGPFTGFLEYLVLRRGISLYRVEGRSDRSYRLSSGQLAPDGTMILGCMLSGSGTVELEGRPGENWRPTGTQYAIDATCGLVHYDLTPEYPWQLIALRLDAGHFAELADRSEDGGLLADAMKQRVRCYNIHRPLGRAARATAHALATPIYQGTMQSLYLEAKALELLAYQFDSFTPDRAEFRDLTAAERLRVLTARELLLSELRDPPTLESIATFARMSERRLNQGFRMLFGATVFEVLRDGRLDAAQELLEGSPELPLKAVAWQVGYANASNFIKAYRRRFGVSPGAHKRLKPLQ